MLGKIRRYRRDLVLVAGLSCLTMTGVGCWPLPGEEVIVDNLDPGCQIVSGAWDLADSSDGNGCWGTNFLYLYADRSNVGRVRFTPSVSTTAQYNVYIYWSAAANRTTAQPVVVHDANGGEMTYSVNLQQKGHQWHLLGKHTMAPTGCYIEFSNDTDSGYCNADAVRLTR